MIVRSWIAREVGERVTAMREAALMEVSELKKATGIDIHSIEAGVTLPSLTQAFLIAEAVGVSIVKLLPSKLPDEKFEEDQVEMIVDTYKLRQSSTLKNGAIRYHSDQIPSSATPLKVVQYGRDLVVVARSRSDDRSSGERREFITVGDGVSIDENEWEYLHTITEGFYGHVFARRENGIRQVTSKQSDGDSGSDSEERPDDDKGSDEGREEEKGKGKGKGK